MAAATGHPILRLRSAAIILRHDAVLLHRGLDDEFWSLPGGGVEPGERTDQALRREIGEELGIDDASIVRLVWVAENRFTYGGRRFHEIGFYWLIDVPEGLCPFHPGEFAMAEPHLRFRWFGLNDVMTTDVKPALLRQGLAALPAATAFVQIEG